jgi:protein SYS1
MQTIHYLAMSLLIPPLLVMFAEPNSLLFEGGAANVGE